MGILRGLLGITVLLACAAILSENRRAIRARVVVWGLALQVALALWIFKTEAGAAFFRGVTEWVVQFLEFSYKGSEFVFGPLGRKQPDGSDFYLAFQALPIVIYFSAVMALLYHLGIMQAVVYVIARLFSRLLGVSGAESMAVAANIFVGMTEAPLVVRPYIERMTRSELMALMTGGLATIAGTVMGVYLHFVGEANGPYLIAASVMSAPAAFVTAKILVPEVETPETGQRLRLVIERQGVNLFDALARGVRDGLQLAFNIAAMLVAFLALLYLLNWPLEAVFGVSLQEVLGFLLSPLAWCLGVEWGDAREVGGLLGIKVTLNELVAYGQLERGIAEHSLSERSAIISTFALCGFANFGSLGVTIGGIGGLAPSRRPDLALLALRALAGGALASFLTAAVAGMFL